MNTPGFPPACAPLVKAVGEASLSLTVLHDLLLTIHRDAEHADAVRLHVAEALEQMKGMQAALTLEEAP